MICNNVGVVLAANHAFSVLVRRPLEALKGAPFLDLVDACDRPSLADRINRLLSGFNRFVERDVRLIDGRGQRLWSTLCLSIIQPGRDHDDGEAYQSEVPVDSDANRLLVIQLRDITESKNLERMLVESERRYRTIFSSLTEGFVQVDEHGTLVEVNDAFCRMLGLTRVDLVGRPITGVLTPEGRAALAAELAVHDQAMTRSFTLSLRHAHGHEVLAAIYPAPLADGGGAGFIALVVDMTEHHRAERELAVREEHYRTLVTSMQDGLVLISDGKFDFVNAAIGASSAWMPPP